MYIQITTKCNMKCAHCALSCSDVGRNMQIETFMKSLFFARDYGYSQITIGGGEPTVHPEFWTILNSAMYFRPLFHIDIITNGKNENIAMTLLDLTNKGRIFALLSQDKYHEHINKHVVDAYHEKGRIWDAGNNVIRSGRGKTVRGAKKGCCCNGPFINPSGKIYSCGCKNRLIGNVFEWYDNSFIGHGRKT